MRVLAFDSGAKRAGWAVLEGDAKKQRHIASGVIGISRNADVLYQEYVLDILEYYADQTKKLVKRYDPDCVVTEIVPVRGMNDFVQGYLAHTMAITTLTTAGWMGCEFETISAQKPQNEIGIKGRGKKMTKPNVRAGVIAHFPKLGEELKAESKVFERSDAICIGIYSLKQV